MLIGDNAVKLVSVHIGEERNYIVERCQWDKLRSMGVTFTYL